MERERVPVHVDKPAAIAPPPGYRQRVKTRTEEKDKPKQALYNVLRRPMAPIGRLFAMAADDWLDYSLPGGALLRRCVHRETGEVFACRTISKDTFRVRGREGVVKEDSSSVEQTRRREQTVSGLWIGRHCR